MVYLSSKFEYGGGGGGGAGLVSQSCTTLVTPWTVASQAPLSIGFSRQEYWNGLPFSSPGDLTDPGIKPRSSALHADSLLTELPGKPSFEYKRPKDIDFVLIHHFILGIWNRL